ncbi:DUF4269 domain-containing protein [Alkalihalobacillus macyae]|uniref:DUF4269 domain-containing protein n=1 Tax=Guptibacillus hwajinpoensis TaxID=208199 RepID=UPI00273BB6F3|nr:DUF4269 domain-containing protein [Alkalihalobacillus macyae]MDP4549599.1 DUF4269 domain-containing protein [Alkalihalobacillus macyae]
MLHIQLVEAMKSGSDKQKMAYKAIEDLQIMDKLRSYNPVVCGTIPIGLDIEGSDLDIIMEISNLEHFENKLRTLYGHKDHFSLKRTTINGMEVVKANFKFKRFDFELFGQRRPVHKQNAYLHMIIEYELMQRVSDLKFKVLELRRQGYKTEPAFCKILGITEDPYQGLISYGIKEGIISK